MKNYFNLCLALCAAFVITACSNQENTPEPQGLTFQLSVGGNGSANGPRRIITNGVTMQTAFTVNDEAGVFAVRGGEIMPRVNNLKLTYNQNGVWVPAAMVPYSEEYDDAIFYAYYPYSDTVTIDLTKDDVFTSVIADFQPSSDQSTAALFGKADLMTTGACRLGTLHSVSLPMEHRMALATIELPNVSYVFTNPGVEPYILVSPENVQFKLETGGELNPYFDEATQTYQLILKPELQDKLIVSYENAGEAVKEEIDQISNIWAGEYARFVIGGGASVTTMTLQVGDYLLSDGTLLSKDDAQAVEANKSKIIAVVYALGTTDGIQAAKPACKHAMALALTEQRKQWGTVGSTTAEQNAAGWKTWYTAYGLNDLGTDKNTNIDLDMLVAQGYENTTAWAAVPVGLEIGGIQVDINSVFAATYADWKTAHPAPAVTTGWFIPSLRDWMNIRATSTSLTPSLTAVEATDLLWNAHEQSEKLYYWSSNLRGAAAMWCYTGFGSTAAELIQASGNKDSRYYRFAIAF